jgi:glycosyltransferase involved in cell wall biosynthesis
VSAPVAVLVPVLDEEDAIGECLDRLLGQTHGDLDVVVIDGGSADRTVELVQQRAAVDPRVRVLRNPDRIQSAGLTRALDAVESARVVVRLDARSFVEPDYVARCVDLLEATGAAEVGGRMVARPAAGAVARGIALANGAWWGAGPAGFHRQGEPGPADTAYLGAFDASWLRKVGGWAPDLPTNEDWELNYRIRRAGGVVWLDPSLEVGYRPRATFGALARQYFRYGRGKATVVRRHPESLLPRQAAPAMLVPVGVAALLARPASLRRPARVALAGHLGIVVVGAARARATAGERCAAAVAALVMHWSWAAGAWYGAVSPFRSRGRR